MISINVKNDAGTNSADVTIEMHGEISDIVTEIVIGSVAAIKKASGDCLTYHDAAHLLCIAINDFENFEED